MLFTALIPLDHTKRSIFRARGRAANLLQPLLDNQVNQVSINSKGNILWPYIGYIRRFYFIKNQKDVEGERLNAAKAVALVKDVLTAAAQRDIYTSDGLVIKIALTVIVV